MEHKVTCGNCNNEQVFNTPDGLTKDDVSTWPYVLFECADCGARGKVQLADDEPAQPRELAEPDKPDVSFNLGDGGSGLSDH